ncbi:MAG: class I mannose-6-phosphate isomerase [Acidobacteriota bacterium]
MNLPTRLPRTPHFTVWGTPQTEPWYPNPERRNIGEIWFAASEQVPLLVKFLFTSGPLSVQVHPPDEYARTQENSPGKTEMWHVLRAASGAHIDLGLRAAMTRESLGEASLSGEIEHLLNWLPARVGDTFFIPAGTIHAIGGGLVMCEVQQRSDVTYRLYDYGRGRELHLARGLEVACLEPYAGRREPVSRNGSMLLAECRYFRTERLSVQGSVVCAPRPKNAIYVALEGEGLIAGQPFQTGDAWEIAAGGTPFGIESPAAAFLITSEP